MFGSNVFSGVSEAAQKAIEAHNSGDNMAAAAAASEALAIAAAATAAALWSASVKLPVKGLDLVLNSLKEKTGLYAEILKKAGMDPLTASRAQAVIKMYASADLAAKGVKFAINWLNKQNIGVKVYDWLHPDDFNRAKKWVLPRDPVILDLGGNGLETVGLASNVYFDHDGDGVLTKTGWVGKDDALLVWDRNANGSIDTGAELFGDFTPLPNGTLAPSGFTALVALDSNGDGILDASDPAFAELRLWRDASQDGISQSGEFITLADAGIVSLNLANILKNQNLANGNQLTREGSFIRADGSMGGMGEFKLAIDTFDTRFVDQVAVPEVLKGLPHMQGSGNVRELQQAAVQSGALTNTLNNFQTTTTRTGQKALLDQLLSDWASTSGMSKSLEERAAGKYAVIYESFGNERRSANLAKSSSDMVSEGGGSGGSSGTTVSISLRSDVENPLVSDHYRQLIAEWSRKMHVLEAFNGQYFFNLPKKVSQTDTANWGMTVQLSSGSGGGGSSTTTTIDAMPVLCIAYSQVQLNLLQQSYDSLKDGVYASLVLQTRLKPYLDQIELIVDEDGIRLDASGLNQLLVEKRNTDPENYLADLLDLDRYASTDLAGTNWNGMTDFDQVSTTLPDTEGIRALLAEFKVRHLTGNSDLLHLSGDQANIVLAGDGHDTLHGGMKADRLFGEQGNDQIFGGDGNDLLSGGAGDDVLYGGAGADFYVFGRGYGNDTISDSLENGFRLNTVQFLGLNPSDIHISINYWDDLTFTIVDTGEMLSIPASGYREGGGGVGRYVFEDGTVWSYEDAVRLTVAVTSDHDDVIHGSSVSDVIKGQKGNDVLVGHYGDDVLDGGEGNDILIGSTEWATISVNGQSQLVHSTVPTVSDNGDDTYLFGRGDGKDTVIDGDNTKDNTDTLLFKEGVKPSDIRLRHLGDDLVLEIRGTEDQITLKKYFGGALRGYDREYLVEQIAFSDGTLWSYDDVQKILFSGNEEAENIIGSHNSDVITGQGGDDTLLGGSRRDVLDGGAGNDVLWGGGYVDWDGIIRNSDQAGDVYRFGRGDGHDTVYEDSWDRTQADRIELKEGINPGDIRLVRAHSTNGWQFNNDLVLTILDTGETLTVRNHFNESGRYAIEEIVFADGTVWDAETIISLSLLGDAGDNQIRGFNGRDDIIAGGGGNDVLDGGLGSDIYRFGLGDGLDVVVENGMAGEDVVELGSAIAPEDVVVRWTLQSGMVVILPDGSQLTVQWQALSPGVNGVGIEQLRFADGTVWDRNDIADRAMMVTEGNDVIVGGRKDDVLDGRAGNDYFQDLGGYDTYLFGVGDGQDVIEDVNGCIQFKPGIGQDDIAFSHDGKDIVVAIKSSGDSVRIKGWLTDQQRIDRFGFDSGMYLSTSDVFSVLKLEAGTEILFGSAGNDVLSGSEVDSALYGRQGNDILSGGAGRDELHGEAGDDVLDGGAGRDRLYGGEGNNAYIVARGMGLDHVVGESLAVANDKVVFAAGIRPEDVSVQLGRQRNWELQPGDVGCYDLVIGIGGDDALVLSNQSWSDLGRGAIQRFVFADGTEWSLADLISRADGGVFGNQRRYSGDPPSLLGSQGDDLILDDGWEPVVVRSRGNDDVIRLGAGGDIVSAGTGSDTVVSGPGDDLVAGEGGDDHIDTGYGDDVIVFNYGDGSDSVIAGKGVDTLSFGAGVAPEMLSVVLDRDGRAVLLVDGGAGGSLTLGGINGDNLPGDLERIQFIDGEGKAQVFDFSGWLRSNAALVTGARVDASVPFSGAGFELTASVPLSGALEAVAYAQQGDLFAVAHLTNNIPSDGDDLLYGSSTGDVLNTGSGNDTVVGFAGDDVFLGGSGHDQIFGGDGNDVLDGGVGDDVIYGGWGADTLTGSQGHDQLNGEWGGDTYIYQRGSGEVIIDDDHRLIGWYGEGGWVDEAEAADSGARPQWDDTPNTLSFGPGIRLEDLQYSRSNGDLVIEFVGRPGDRIVLRGYEPGRATLTRSVDIIHFDDGTEIYADDINVIGTTGVLGNLGGNLNGTEFADTLIGGDGDDVLNGNGGSDRLAGEVGSDIYHIRKKSGSSVFETLIAETWREQDTNRIELTGEIVADDLRLEVDGGDLLLRLTQQGDVIRFVGFDPAAPGMKAPITEVNLPDLGVSFSFEDLLARGVRIAGTPNNDVLMGTALGDLIEGRGANDTMSGGAGGDLYTIDADGGYDTIIDSENGDAPNVLVLPEGSTLDDIRLSYNGEGFLILSTGNSGNQVRLSGFDPENPLGPRAIERFRFGLKGEEVSYEQLLAHGFDIIGTVESDVLKGTELTDRISGGGGNDRIEASSGGDWLMGGGGSDTYLVDIGDGVVTIDDIAGENYGNTLRFGIGIDPKILRNNLRFKEEGNGSYVLLIPYGSDEDVVRLTGLNPNDVLGGRAVESFEFSDGTVVDYATLVSWTFVVEGDSSGNLLTGTNVGDRLYGYDSDDFLEANAGEDVLTGGRGNDVLWGGAGRDNYVVELGDGEDLIEDAVESGIGNVLVFGEGIRREDVRVEMVGDDLLIHYGSGGDKVRVAEYAAGGFTVIDTFAFADGTAVTLREFMNRAPEVANPVVDQVIQEDAAFSLQLPENLFVDADGDEILTRVAVAGYTQLPQWLKYDAVTRTLYGMPENADVGGFDVVIQGMDKLGASAFHSFHVTVRNTNDAPEAGAALPDLRAVEDGVFSFALPADSFHDKDVGDVLSYSATLENGDPLPEWLVFDAQTRIFSSTPSNGNVGDLRLRVTATDSAGEYASQVFSLAVVNTNDAPTVGSPLAVQAATEDVAFSYALPAGAFVDADLGDRLSYTATLANGDALPAWLKLDGTTGIFSGTPGNGDVGEVQIRVTAADLSGASASQELRFSVGNTNDAPEVGMVLSGQQATEDAPFTFTVPEYVFRDVDVGDVLTLSATRADGSALPPWLSFDAATRTFSGTPGNDDVGSLLLKMTGTDRSGAQVSQTFTVGVTNVNDAPETGALLINQKGRAGTPVNWKMPNGAFVDVDAGDTLTYTASLGDGGKLPDWLKFDATTGTFSGTPTTAGTHTLRVTATDASGAQASQAFTLNILSGGENLAPITAPDAENLMEDRKLLAWGNVLNNDRDPEGKTLKVADPGIRQGEYGILTLLSNGSYAYVLNDFSSKVQGLGEGETVTEHFSYQASDGTVRNSGELTVTVQGTNDSAELARRLVDVQLGKGKSFSWQLPAGSFIDRDRNDKLTYMAKLADGKALPSWLKFDAATQTFSGTAPANAKNSIEVRVMASDGHGESSVASDVFKVSFGSRTIIPSSDDGGFFDWGGDLPSPWRPCQQSDGSEQAGTRPGERPDGDPLGRFLDKFFSDTKQISSGLPILDRNWFAQWESGRKPSDPPEQSRGNQDFERHWSELTHVLNRLDAERQSAPAWSQASQGAPSGLAGLIQGSIQGGRGGTDAVSLACGGTQLKAFTGLREGIGKLLG